MSVTGRYLSRLFLKRLALIVFGFALMALLFDVLNNADTIEKRYGEGFLVVPRYMLFRLPEMVGLITPFATLLAALLTLLGLAQQNEVLAFKAAGMSFYRMLLLLMPAAALVAIGHIAIADQLTPWAKKRLARYELEKPTDDETNPRDQAKGVWLRDPAYIVNVANVKREGRYLTGVTLMRRDKASNIVERIVAGSARYQRGQWKLENVVTQFIDPLGPHAEKKSEWVWQTPLRPADFFNLAATASQFSARELLVLRTGTTVGTRPGYTYDTWLQRRLALPGVILVMLLLAAPVAQARVRMSSLGARLAFGVSLGFLFFITDGVSQALGESGAVLPLVAAWASPILFASVAGSVLLRIEGL
ncbi:MAG: LPS export ABC transporter permease LptG [Alphaproteobacteria bacterium]|nr:LPS export ABC transporter permease LptG [Alphaproteobacteria bacterium]